MNAGVPLNTVKFYFVMDCISKDLLLYVIKHTFVSASVPPEK